jgi:CRP/FNR family cyclic AMP-dependent transcriptional regulator
MSITLNVICWNFVGYLASGLVLAAFASKAIIPLRAIAIASNVAFLIYGIALGLAPVWLLHAFLLPLNTWRLFEALLRAR